MDMIGNASSVKKITNIIAHKKDVNQKKSVYLLIHLSLINVWFVLLVIMDSYAKRFLLYVKKECITYYLGLVYSAN